MNTQPTLNQIGRTKVGDTIYQTSRVFVVEPSEETGEGGYAVVYVAQDGKAIPVHIARLVSFERSRYPRRQPHLIEVQTADGGTETWECTLAGCGCGNPVKKVNWTTALKDYTASLTPAPE